ncbi:MAG TPA: hypothetical protein DDZ76_00240 [Xanthomonadales bacterium]|nr:hypothetical protein [Xanthomonadales bacterium]
MFGVVCALDWEARCLPRQADGLRVVVSGMGAAAAAAAARELVEQGVRGLIDFGSAGGLDPARQAGDLLLPARVLNSDGASFSADPDLHARLAAALAAVGLSSQHAAVLEVSAALAAPADKAECRARYHRQGVAAVDMESAAVAQVAAQAGLPFLAVRAVLDAADRRLPGDVLATVDAAGRPQAFALIAALCRRPSLVGDLLALAVARDRAAATLRRAGIVLAAGFDPVPR